MKYYSEKLNKNFDAVEDLEKAEKAEEEKNALVSKEKEKRQKEVAEIQDAANGYLKLVAENNKVRDQLKEKENAAYADYKAKIEEFSKAHKNYHLSYTYDGKNVEFEVEEIRYDSIEEYMRQRHAAMKKMIEEFMPW